MSENDGYVKRHVDSIWNAPGLYLGLIGLILWFLTVHDANYLRMGAYGLVSILGWPYFAGLACVVVGFVAELLRGSLRPWLLVPLLMLLVLFMYGTACAVEPVAELTDSWISAGFAQYILVHGHSLNGYDARFSWPGGFSLTAMLVAFTGQRNALGFIRWFPLFIEMAYMAPLLVISRFSGVSRRAGLLGIAICYATNWIFQDYFSPQALNYLFYLVVIATVLACWRPKPREAVVHPRGFWTERYLQSRAVMTRSRIQGADTISVWEDRDTLIIFALLVLICLACAISHQLTPYALSLALLVCLFTRRLGRPELVVLLGVFTLGWLSLGASNYWVGHLGEIFGSAGQLSGTVSSNLTSRVAGATAHLTVVKMRILLTGALYLLAGVGFLRRNTDSRALEALTGAPFVLVVAQSYGGEALLRVVLYGLPFASLLAASAILPRRSGAIRSFVPSLSLPRLSRIARWTIPGFTVLVVLACALTTTVVRGGNDAYVSFSKGELAAVNYVYDHIGPGGTVGAPNYFLPFGQRDVGKITFFTPPDLPSYKKNGRQILRNAPEFIVLSQSEEAYGEQVLGYPVGWEGSLESMFVNDGYKIAAEWRTAVVLTESTSESQPLPG